MTTRDKVYIGGGVYAAYDGEHIVLTVEDGISIKHTIYLNADVWDNLMEYRKWRLAQPEERPQ